MKKLVLLLISILLIGMMPLGLAEPELVAQVTFDEPLGQHRENPRLFVLNDTLYSFSRYANRILCWKPGETSMRDYAPLPQSPAESREMQYREMDAGTQAQMEQTVTHVIAGNDKLWAINQFSGKFGELTEQGPRYRDYSLDLSGLHEISEKDSYVNYNGFVIGGNLYLFTRYSENSFYATYDLRTGERHNTPLKYDGWASPYNAGKAFYVVDIRSGSSSGGYAEKLYELDLATGQLEESPLPVLEKTKHEVMIKSISPSAAGNGFFLCTESFIAPPQALISVYSYEDGDDYIEMFKGPLPDENKGYIIFLHPINADMLIAVNGKGAAVYDIGK